jgi:hypothetical protein
MCDGVESSCTTQRKPSPGFRLAREVAAFPVTRGQSTRGWLVVHCLLVTSFWPTAVFAEAPVVIGATQQQEQFLTCVAEISADDLRNTPHANERLAVVILEHRQFLELREAFHLHKTRLAFSGLAARRIYLSSRVLRDHETLLRCVTHELGHFATQSAYEDHAERAAERIRQRARQICWSSVQ